MKDLLLDTHIWIWLSIEDEVSISNKAKKAIKQADQKFDGDTIACNLDVFVRPVLTASMARQGCDPRHAEKIREQATCNRYRAARPDLGIEAAGLVGRQQALDSPVPNAGATTEIAVQYFKLDILEAQLIKMAPYRVSNAVGRHPLDATEIHTGNRFARDNCLVRVVQHKARS